MRFVAQIQRLDVTEYDTDLDEAGGDTGKNWLRDPTDGNRWLFKKSRIHTSPPHRTTADLSEVAANRIATAIGIPTAEYRLARHGNDDGCISLDISEPTRNLYTGWMWIKDTHPEYVKTTYETENLAEHKKNPEQYGYGNLCESLKTLETPTQCGAADGYTLFCGYLMLDALIANTDRHAHNWAVSTDSGNSRNGAMLAPSFDHEASLGYQLLDTKKAELLATRGGVDRWVMGGKASRFSGSQGRETRSLVDYFVAASKLADQKEVIDQWLCKVGSELTEDKVTDLIPGMEGISEVSVEFAREVVNANVRRVLK